MTLIAVDIVITNYNYARFLSDAIESALAQRHPATHVIVVDDGSTDNSQEVIMRFRSSVSTVFKGNGGQASACNLGWRHCHGDVVIFLDADDALHPDAAAGVAAAFTADPAAAKVQYRLAVMDEHGRATGELKPPAHIRMPTGELSRSELTFPFDLTWMATSGNAFSAATLARIMPIPEGEFRASADWYLNHLAPLLGTVVSLPEVYGCFRVHGENSYEMSDTILDLAHTRRTICYSAATRRHLRRAADELGLPLRPGPILSVADLANRIISCKLEPEAHPLSHDRVWKLAVAGVLAALRRFDVRWEMKLLFVAWFATMALAPRRATSGLAELFLFPELRQRINPLLGRLTSPGERGSTGSPPSPVEDNDVPARTCG